MLLGGITTATSATSTCSRPPQRLCRKARPTRRSASVRDFNVHQNPKVFDRLKCSCKATWEDVLDMEGMFQGPMMRWDDPMRQGEDED